MKKYFGYTIALLLLMTSCNKTISDNSKTIDNRYTLFIPATTNISNVKASYNNVNNVAEFAWEKSSDLIVATTNNYNNFSVWDNNTYYSFSDIVPDNNNKKIATISSNGTLEDISNLKIGNNIFCFTPYNNSNKNINIKCSSNNIELSLSLPNTFMQSSFDKLNELNAFTYLYANSQIANISKSNNYINAKRAEFTTIPAIIQFNITNTLSSSVNVKSVSMRIIDPENNSTINIPNQLILTAEPGKEPSINEPTNNTSYHNSITAELKTPSAIKQNESKALFAYILPSNSSINGKTFEFIVVTSENKEYKITKKNVDLSIKSGKHSFLSGYKYTFDIKLEKSEDEVDYEKLYFDRNHEKNSFKTRALGIYFTSVGCVYCPAVEDRINKLHDTPTRDSVVFVTMFESSTFSHFKVKYLYKDLATGTPSVNLDLDVYKKKVGYFSVENLQEEIRENFNRNTLNGQIGIAASVSTNNKGDITIDAVVKSAKARDDVKISAWIIEDGLYDNNKKINHDRGYVAGTITYPVNPYNYIASYYGEPVGNIAENGYAKKTINIPKDASNNMSDISKCKVVIFVTAVYNNYGGIRVINTIQCNIGETKYFEYN